MKMKRILALMLAALCLCLTACGGGNQDPPPDDEIVGGDWRVTGVVRDAGSITRGGADTDVLVCVNEDGSNFYYDEEEQTLYAYVEYPVTISDPWDSFQSIDFADRNGDDDGDVAMLFDVDGETVLMVWFWDEEAGGFVFQPEESSDF